MKKSVNPSAIRSRKLIINGMLSLMTNEPYDLITITQICLQAQIVRKTFYRHFKNKEDVLDEYIEMLYSDYINMLKSLPEKNTFSITLTYFQFWEKHIDFLQLLYKNNLLLLILKKYDILLPELSKEFQCMKSNDEVIADYITSYSSGGYWKLLCKWIERNFKETPLELANIHIKVINWLSESIYKTNTTL